jgi:hypothetical protein
MKPRVLVALLLTWAVALLPVLVLAPPPAQAQVAAGLFDTRAIPVGTAYTADDTSPAILVGYRGATAGGWLTVAANGDMTFEETDTSTVSTTLECPVSGALGGIIDVSDTACDTVGEVVNIINDSGVFYAIPITALYGDSSNDTFLAVSDQAVSSSTGYAVKWDTDVALTSSIPMLPYALTYDINRYLNPTGSSGAKIKTDPFAGFMPTFIYANITSTYGSGSSSYGIYCIRDTFDASSKNWTSAQLLATTGLANAATTVLKEHTVFANAGYQCPRDTRMIARATNSAAMASTTHVAYGKLFPLPTR